MRAAKSLLVCLVSTLISGDLWNLPRSCSAGQLTVWRRYLNEAAVQNMITFFWTKVKSTSSHPFLPSEQLYPLKCGTSGDSLSRRANLGFDPQQATFARTKSIVILSRTRLGRGGPFCWGEPLTLTIQCSQTWSSNWDRAGKKKAVSAVAELVVRSEGWSICCSRDKDRELRIRQRPHRETSFKREHGVPAC